MPSPKYIIATDRRLYTPTASTEDADRPATNLLLEEWPARTWRDDGTGEGSSIICDLGASPPALAACVLYGGLDMADRSPEQTVTLWDVEESATGTGGWSAIPEGQLAVPIDVEFGKRRGFFPITTTERYVRFTVAIGGLAAGATYAQLGVLDLYAAADLVTLGQNPSQPEIEPVDPVTLFEPDGGGHAVNEDGPPYALFALTGRWFRSYGVDAQIHAIRALGPSRVLALFQNNGDASQVYLGRIVRRTSYGPGNAAFVDMGLGFREVT